MAAARLQLLEDRAIRPLIAVTAVRERLQGVTQADQFADSAV